MREERDLGVFFLFVRMCFCDLCVCVLDGVKVCEGCSRVKHTVTYSISFTLV